MTEPRHPTAPAVSTPRVTYLIAAHNAEATLRDALDSLVRQDCDDWRAIVVDDGSSDGTLAAAQALAARDDRILVLSQANEGPASARNHGAQHAASEFLACLDADDELADDHLSKMLDLVDRHPECTVFSSDGYFVRSDGSREPVFGYENELSLTLEDLMARSLILGGGTVMRADAFRALGGYQPDSYCEDYDLWLRALAAGYHHIARPDRLYFYRMGSSCQKSTDRIASAESAILSLAGLVGSGQLSDDQRAAAERDMASYRTDLDLERQAIRLRQAVERVFGTRMARPVIAAVHSLSWTTRPVRRWLAARRAAATGADRGMR